jgi:TldD protein
VKRRQFLHVIGGSAAAIAASDAFLEVLAQPRVPREARLRDLADIALGEAKKLDATYADLRITRNRALSVAARDRVLAEGGGGPGGGGPGGGGGGGGGFGGGGGPADNSREDTHGFGVRVIVNGTWGFASSPIVTPDEVRRVTRVAADVARASSIAKKFDVRLAPVPPYTDYYRTPIARDVFEVPLDELAAQVLAVNAAILENKDVSRAVTRIYAQHEWKYLATSEGSHIEQDVYRTSPASVASARYQGAVRSRMYFPSPRTGGYEVVAEAKMLDHARRIAAEAVEFSRAKPVAVGLKDLILTPSHASLTIHEIVAHATELDRIVGYEANYAGTSFVKLTDVGKLKYGSKHFNVTADRTIPGGMATVGYDDDGVKTQQWPLVREGILVGLQTNRETAHFLGEKESRGCTFANHWRNYPFLRMPNVHVDAGPAGSPTPDELIADVKEGVLIDGRGSFSIDQQRYNGQFGGDCFWAIRNGKKAEMLADVTYNAITTDFWANLDAISGPESWELNGLVGDAKGQPVQTNYPSHGSPWLRIRKIMVGAAQQ